LPLSDRDYMRPSPPPRRRVWTGGGTGGFLQNPVYIIIIVNLIIFIAALIDKVKIVGNLGLSPSLFTEQPWTVLTAMFVHAEFWHFFGNMITLFFFGRVLYQLVGTGRFLLVYFIGGIVGNLLYVWLGEPFSIAIGASGAIYAVAGALVVMMPTMRVAIWGILPMPLWAVVLLFFVLWSIPNFIPGIAWQAHLGGIVIGLAAGYYFRRTLRYLYIR
jgi:membrane associated rhomboid family serine protease